MCKQGLMQCPAFAGTESLAHHSLQAITSFKSVGAADLRWCTGVSQTKNIILSTKGEVLSREVFLLGLLLIVLLFALLKTAFLFIVTCAHLLGWV